MTKTQVERQYRDETRGSTAQTLNLALENGVPHNARELSQVPIVRYAWDPSP